MINFDVESMLIAFSSQFSSSFKVNLGVLIICFDGINDFLYN